MSEEIQIPNLDLMPRADLPQIWDVYRAQVSSLKETALSLTINSADQIKEIKLARTTRLALKEIRVAVEKRRKELGEGLLRETQKINGAAKELKEAIELLEQRLLHQEQYVEREQAASLDRLRQDRLIQLAPYLTAPPAVDVGLISEDTFIGFLSDAKDLHELKTKREAEAEVARLAEIERQAEERRMIAEDNIRLRKEAAAAAASLEEERANQRERQRIRDEALQIEREARDAEVQRIQAEAKAEKEAERKAASAPDKEKLLEFSNQVRDLGLPIMSTSEGYTVANEIAAKCLSFSKWITEQASKL